LILCCGTRGATETSGRGRRNLRVVKKGQNVAVQKKASLPAYKERRSTNEKNEEGRVLLLRKKKACITDGRKPVEPNKTRSPGLLETAGKKAVHNKDMKIGGEKGRRAFKGSVDAPEKEAVCRDSNKKEGEDSKRGV